MAPIDVAIAQRLAHQQRGKAGAIDEEIAFHHASAFEANLIDKAIFAAQRDIGDFAFNALDAPGLSVVAQKLRVERRVESDRRICKTADPRAD